MSSRVDDDRLREEYLEWLLLDDATRRAHGLPRSDREWAAHKGKADRTLRRWKDREDFQERLRQRREQIARGAANSTVAPSPEGRPYTDPRSVRRFEAPEPVQRERDRIVSEAASEGVTDPEERDYLAVKSSLRDKAMDGDPRALELYMKHWGQSFAGAERDRAESRFPDLSDDELVGELLSLVGVDAVRGWLESAGV